MRIRGSLLTYIAIVALAVTGPTVNCWGGESVTKWIAGCSPDVLSFGKLLFILPHSFECAIADDHNPVGGGLPQLHSRALNVELPPAPDSYPDDHTGDGSLERLLPELHGDQPLTDRHDNPVRANEL
jgi:hypothetical protein